MASPSRPLQFAAASRRLSRREIKHRVGVVRGGVQRPTQTIDCSFGPTLLVQQVGKIVPSLREHRISVSNPMSNVWWAGPSYSGKSMT